MENGINKISVYGDSILKGAVTDEKEQVLFSLIEKDSLTVACSTLKIELNNKSVFGSTVIKTQKRLNKDIKNGIKSDLVIIESGGNDCDYDWSLVSKNPDFPHLPKTPLDDFIRIIGEMIEIVRANKITPLIMTMPPLVSDLWYKHICFNQNKENISRFIEGNPNKLYQNHERYNLCLLDICKKNNIQYIDMRLAMLNASNYRCLMCNDGIHPNRNGYMYMAEIWKKELPKIKREF